MYDIAVPRALTVDEVEDFREELCRAASRQFARAGLAGVTLRGLAAELGCSPMTPYRYFRNKAEILATLRARAFDRLTAAADAATRRGRDPIARLRGLGRAYLRFARQHPDEYRLMFELGQEGDAAWPELRLAESRAWAALRDPVAEAVASRAIRGRAETVAHCFWAGLHGLVTLELAGKLRAVRIEALAEPMIETLLAGVGAE